MRANPLRRHWRSAPRPLPAFSMVPELR
jgi:hypothetical protein